MGRDVEKNEKSLEIILLLLGAYAKPTSKVLRN